MAAATRGGCFLHILSWDERALGRWERKGHPLSAYRQARPTGPCTYLGMWSWTFLPSAVSANFVSPQAPRVSCRPPTFAIVLEQENGYRISTAIRYPGIRNWLDPSRKLVIPYSGAGLCRLSDRDQRSAGAPMVYTIPCHGIYPTYHGAFYGVLVDAHHQSLYCHHQSLYCHHQRLVTPAVSTMVSWVCVCVCVCKAPI